MTTTHPHQLSVRDLPAQLRDGLGVRSTVAIVRDLVDLADRDDLGAQALTRLVAALTGQDITLALNRHATDALEAHRVARRLADADLDIATLIDHPTTTSLDQVLEQTIEAYELEVTIECRHLAGAL